MTELEIKLRIADIAIQQAALRGSHDINHLLLTFLTSALEHEFQSLMNKLLERKNKHD